MIIVNRTQKSLDDMSFSVIRFPNSSEAFLIPRSSQLTSTGQKERRKGLIGYITWNYGRKSTPYAVVSRVDHLHLANYRILYNSVIV